MGWDTVPESCNIELKLFRVQVHGSKVVDEHIHPVLALATRGHFIPAEIEVKPTGKLGARAPHLAIDVVDVKGFKDIGQRGRK